MAAEIRAAISAELGLTASAGVAPNKFLAKLASGSASLTACSSSAPRRWTSSCASSLLASCPASAARRQSGWSPLGLYSCEDARQLGNEELIARFGKLGEMLASRIWGHDDQPVQARRVRKSIGVERRSPATCWTRTPAGRCSAGSFPSWSSVLPRPACGDADGAGIKLKFADFHPDHRLSQGGYQAALPDLLHEGLQRAQESPFACSVWSLVLPERVKSIKRLDFC